MQNPIRRRRTVNHLRDDAPLRQEYFQTLAKTFIEAEDLENAEALFNIFYIYKNVVTYGDQKIVELLLSDEMYIDFFGALERDPTYLNLEVNELENEIENLGEDLKE